MLENPNDWFVVSLFSLAAIAAILLIWQFVPHPKLSRRRLRWFLYRYILLCRKEVPPPNRPPVAEAGLARVTEPYQTVELNGWASFDPDGDELTYEWMVIAVPREGGHVSLEGDRSVQCYFCPDTIGYWLIGLIVRDQEDDSDFDVVPVSVEEPPPLPPISPLKRIAFTSNRNQTHIFAINSDGSGLRRLSAAPVHDPYYQWSPDHTQLLYLDNTDDPDSPPTHHPIYVVNADGSGHHQAEWSIAPPVWSPDGTKIAAKVLRDSDNRVEIFLANVDGSGWRNLTNNPGSDDYAPTWAPDGTRIAFISNRDNHYAIYTINIDGSGLHRVTAASVDSKIQWSPDGTHLAFDFSRDIYVVRVDGSGLTNVTNHPGYNSNFEWCLDSRRIKFDSWRSHQDGIHRYGIYFVNADGTGFRNLASSDYYSVSSKLSPDGRWVAFLEGTMLWAIGSHDLFGITLKKLAENVSSFVWSPNSTHLAFASPLSYPSDIYVVNIDGSASRNLTNTPRQDDYPVWG